MSEELCPTCANRREEGQGRDPNGWTWCQDRFHGSAQPELADSEGRAEVERLEAQLDQAIAERDEEREWRQSARQAAADAQKREGAAERDLVRLKEVVKPILAAHRSTEAHVTEEQITKAWEAFDA